MRVSISPHQHQQGVLADFWAFTNPIADGWYFIVISISLTSKPKSLYFIFYEWVTSFAILFVVTFYVLRKISFCDVMQHFLCVCFFCFVRHLVFIGFGHAGKLDFYIIEFIGLLRLLDFMSYSERLYFLWIIQCSIFLLQHWVLLCYFFKIINVCLIYTK